MENIERICELEQGFSIKTNPKDKQFPIYNPEKHFGEYDRIYGPIWIKIDDIYLKSNNLRKENTPQKIPYTNIYYKTKSIKEQVIYLEEKINNNHHPIFINKDNIENKLIVYEGRHRLISAKKANREYILCYLIGDLFPHVINQKNKKNKKYYNQDIYNINEFIKRV